MVPQRAILLLGAPLAGKGTLAKLLSNNYPQYLSHWESSTILKEYAAANNDERAEAIREIFSGERIVSTKLLNDHDLVAIITDHEVRHRDPARTALLDGVIRTVRQAELLGGLFDLTTTLYFDHASIGDKELERRVRERHRPGETLEHAKERIRIYERTGLPLLRWHYDRHSSGVVRLNAAKTIPDVLADARAALYPRGYIGPVSNESGP